MNFPDMYNRDGRSFGDLTIAGGIARSMIVSAVFCFCSMSCRVNSRLATPNVHVSALIVVNKTARDCSVWLEILAILTIRDGWEASRYRDERLDHAGFWQDGWVGERWRFVHGKNSDIAEGESRGLGFGRCVVTLG